MSWRFAKKLCRRCDAWAGTLLWWSCQSPAAHSCGLLSHPNSFQGGNIQAYCKIWCRFVALFAQSFWMQWPHSIHLTQLWLLPPLTNTVKSSLFTHAHSSPLSLAARINRRGANCSHYINNGWIFPRQTSYTYMNICLYRYTYVDDQVAISVHFHNGPAIANLSNTTVHIYVGLLVVSFWLRRSIYVFLFQ